MRLKRRVLPDFESASLLLFALLAAGTALPARAQFSVGPTKPTAQAHANRPAAAASTPRASASATAASPALSGASTPSGTLPPVGKSSTGPATLGAPAAPAKP